MGIIVGYWIEVRGDGVFKGEFIEFESSNEPPTIKVTESRSSSLEDSSRLFMYLTSEKNP
jgi:hypothetical protein